MEAYKRDEVIKKEDLDKSIKGGREMFHIRRSSTR